MCSVTVNHTDEKSQWAKPMSFRVCVCVLVHSNNKTASVWQETVFIIFQNDK